MKIFGSFLGKTMINKSKIVKIKLKRDISKKIKQGNPWIFEDTLESKPKADPGSIGKLVDRKNKFLAFGIYYPESPLIFRVLTLIDKVPNEEIVKERVERAIHTRSSLLQSNTNGYRLLNGEGDLLPGLVVDIFNKVAVLQLDGPGPFGFYNRKEIATYLKTRLDLDCVYFKARHNSDQKSEVLIGELDTPMVEFSENGAKFKCHVVEGQKTGFFLDQRDNRLLIRTISKDLNVLNMFSYTGGFSINAGLGGAKSVTSVDISNPATENAILNWNLNKLGDCHKGVAQNCYNFVEEKLQEKKKYGLVIVDPPSYAPSKKSLDAAISGYEKIFVEGLKLCDDEAYFAASSCSSHINHELFLEICRNSISKARKRAQVLYIGGQGIDHPFPLALSEMRYLKFVLFKLF